MTSELEHRRDLAMEQTTSGDVPGLQTPFFSIRWSNRPRDDPAQQTNCLRKCQVVKTVKHDFFLLAQGIHFH